MSDEAMINGVEGAEVSAVSTAAAALAAPPPVIALVGRPNVGKSTLFNCLTRSRDALVADFPGLTRDRQYGSGEVADRRFIVIDTGGLSGEAVGIDPHMAQQVDVALLEADRILFLVDARAGLTAADEQIATRLRLLGKPVMLVLNKIDGVHAEVAAADFYALGLGTPEPVAASHGRGVQTMMGRLLADIPPAAALDETVERRIRVAVAGRPNVGKSTLINRLLGEDRVLVYDMPGTTRDSIFIPFERAGRDFTLIDTAGVRRRARVNEMVEKFSIVKTLQAVSEANVVIVVLDAREGITEQDAHLIGFVIESGRALVLAVNKWDGLTAEQKERVKRDLDLRLPFATFARRYRISALHGSGVGDLFDAVVRAYDAASRDLATPELTRLLEDAVATHQPPLVKGRRVKLRYAHQGGRNPPLIVIHGTQAEALPAAYQRYLENLFRQQLRLEGTPIRLELKSGDNPYAGRKNTLTPRQIAKRKRLQRFVKKGARR